MSALVPIFTAVASASLRASLLILALLALRPLVRGRLPSAIVFWCWILIGVQLLGMAAIPAAWSPYRFLRWPLVWSGGSGTKFTAETASAAKSLPKAQPPVNPNSATTGKAVAPAGRLADFSALSLQGEPGLMAKARELSFRETSALVWIMGVLIFAGLRLGTAVGFWRRVRAGRVAVDARLTEVVQRVVDQVGVAAPVEIVASREIGAPAVSGWWIPKLLLPAKFSDALGEDDLRWVALHELAHWKRRDGWAQALLEWARIVHWFNPLVWALTRAARLDCELACDEFVLRRAAAAEPSAYGAALLNVLGVVGGQRRGSPLMVGIFENKKQLKRRIQMIAKYREWGVLRTTLGIALAVGVCAIGLTREAVAQTNASTSQDQIPAGWHKNGQGPQNYLVNLDRNVTHNKPVSLHVMSSTAGAQDFGGMMQSIAPDNYVGKRVRFSAWIKTNNVERSANVWIRVDSANHNSRPLAFDNLAKRAPKGTTDWALYSVVVDVPEGAAGIFFGFFVSGNGEAWFSAPTFEVVDASVPLTEGPLPKLPDAPQNLEFNAGSP